MATYRKIQAYFTLLTGLLITTSPVASPLTKALTTLSLYTLLAPQQTTANLYTLPIEGTAYDLLASGNQSCLLNKINDQHYISCIKLQETTLSQYTLGNNSYIYSLVQGDPTTTQNHPPAVVISPDISTNTTNFPLNAQGEYDTHLNNQSFSLHFPTQATENQYKARQPIYIKGRGGFSLNHSIGIYGEGLLQRTNAHPIGMVNLLVDLNQTSSDITLCNGLATKFLYGGTYATTESIECIPLDPYTLYTACIVWVKGHYLFNLEPTKAVILSGNGVKKHIFDTVSYPANDINKLDMAGETIYLTIENAEGNTETLLFNLTGSLIIGLRAPSEMQVLTTAINTSQALLGGSYSGHPHMGTLPWKTCDLTQIGSTCPVYYSYQTNTTGNITIITQNSNHIAMIQRNSNGNHYLHHGTFTSDAYCTGYTPAILNFTVIAPTITLPYIYFHNIDDSCVAALTVQDQSYPLTPMTTTTSSCDTTSSPTLTPTRATRNPTPSPAVKTPLPTPSPNVSTLADEIQGAWRHNRWGFLAAFIGLLTAGTGSFCYWQKRREKRASQQNDMLEQEQKAQEEQDLKELPKENPLQSTIQPKRESTPSPQPQQQQYQLPPNTLYYQPNPYMSAPSPRMSARGNGLMMMSSPSPPSTSSYPPQFYSTPTLNRSRNDRPRLSLQPKASYFEE